MQDVNIENEYIFGEKSAVSCNFGKGKAENAFNLKKSTHSLL